MFLTIMKAKHPTPRPTLLNGTTQALLPVINYLFFILHRPNFVHGFLELFLFSEPNFKYICPLFWTAEGEI